MNVASRLVVGLSGRQLHTREATWLRLWQPAGVILFARNVTDAAQCRQLIGAVRECLPAGAEICADHEGGAVSFLAAAIGPAPAPRTLGDLDDPQLTLRVHREMAERLCDLGLDRVLAPCCDVLSEARNPVIGSRSFGGDSARVEVHVRAAVLGLREAGLAGCAKHWPGHGATDVDTHDREAVASPAAEAPFLAALSAGIDAWMVGHLRTGPERPPASLDAERLAELRRRHGSSLQLWCDDASMGALRPALAAVGVDAGDGRASGLVDVHRLGRHWLDAIAGAGCDRLLLRGIPWAAFPLHEGEPGPTLPAAQPLALATPVPASPSAEEAWRRAVDRLPVSLDGPRLLWLDATGGDRLGEASELTPSLRRRWRDLVRLDAAAPRLAPQPVFDQLLVTSHRPLTMAQAALLTDQVAALGEALVAGHPSLAGDAARLLGPGWTVGQLAGFQPPDLAPLLQF